MPSSNIDNCARVSDTVPSCALGQMKRPRSSPLRKQTQTVTIPPEQLDQIATPAPKDEDMTGEGVLFENGLHRRTQSGETTSKVRHSGGDPRCAFRLATQSSDEAFQCCSHAIGIGCPFDPHTRMSQIDVNDARSSCSGFSAGCCWKCRNRFREFYGEQCGWEHRRQAGLGDIAFAI
jgi:hypothetical protein